MQKLYSALSRLQLDDHVCYSVKNVLLITVLKTLVSKICTLEAIKHNFKYQILLKSEKCTMIWQHFYDPMLSVYWSVLVTSYSSVHEKFFATSGILTNIFLMDMHIIGHVNHE